MTNLHQTYIFQRYYFKAISALKKIKIFTPCQESKKSENTSKNAFSVF